jgi:hypothetical protein
MRAWTLTACLLLCSSAPAIADTYVVAPDGSGDFPTIQAAINAAVDGDVITLTDGTFTGGGNRDLDYLGKAITLQSQSGDPETCVIDCQGNPADPHRGVNFVSGEPEGSVLMGITIQGGYAVYPEYGGAIRCEGASAPAITACVLYANQGTAVSGAISCSPAFTDCRFTNNAGIHAGAIAIDRGELRASGCDFVGNEAEGGAAAVLVYETVAQITRCRFIGNTSPGASAAEFTDQSEVTLSDCLFEDNVCTDYGGALVFWLSGPNVVEHCTFVGNAAAHGAATIFSEKVCDTYVRHCTLWGNACPDGTIWAGNYILTLENCILAGSTDGPAVYSFYDYAELTCCDIYGNAGGDWVGTIADQFGINGNICEDPLLCDPENGDFHLDCASPCAPFSPQNPECDLTGAWPVGCGASLAPTQTWGAIKALYRP